MTGRAIAAACVLVVAAACSGGRSSASSGSRDSPRATTCGVAASAPAHYDSVIVFSFENRRWRDVGLGFGSKLPYLHALGTQCTWFPTWTETARTQDSLAQYVGQVTGASQPGTVDDCSPSRRCSTRADNIFRQVRRTGRRAVNFVEGANEPCSASGNAVRHIPALYLRNPSDRRHCDQQVRPLTDLKPDALPAFAFVTPTECNDGHDCGNATVDRWARRHIGPVLDSDAYQAGKVAVFVWYDEDTPVPNLWITPTARPGPSTAAGAGAAATLRAWESMLGLPCLADACRAPDLRPAARS